jgi:Peptidase M50B-like
VQTESDLFAAAAHEAGHAIVAQMLGLRVAFLEIAADGSGKSSIEPAHHLEIADQIAVYTAGSQAVKLLGFEQRRQAAYDDHVKVYELLNAYPEAEHDHLRSEGYRRASQILRDRRGALDRVAARLWRKWHVDGTTFKKLISPAPP